MLLLRSFAVAVALIGLLASTALAETATHYGDGTDGYAGKITASGEVCCAGYTAAHPFYPLGSEVLVIGPSGKEVIVRINDRGANLDLSPAAAGDTGVLGCGRCEVETYLL
jgi:rare lipoprotein A